MKVSFLAVVAGALLVSTAAAAQSVAGTWEATVTTPNGVGTPTLIFAVKGDSVTGTVKRGAGDVPLRGIIKGNDLTYSYTIPFNTELILVTVKAKVTGDSLTGTADFGGRMTGDVKAKRNLSKP